MYSSSRSLDKPETWNTKFVFLFYIIAALLILNFNYFALNSNSVNLLGIKSAIFGLRRLQMFAEKEL